MSPRVALIVAALIAAAIAATWLTGSGRPPPGAATSSTAPTSPTSPASMSPDAEWFRQSIAEKRRYRLWMSSLIKYEGYVKRGIKSSFHLPVRAFFEVVGETDDSMDVEGAHSMNPPASAADLAALEKAVGAPLPADFVSFQRSWGGGFLFLGQYHYLLSPREILSYTRTLRGLRSEPDASPWRVVRFCDVEEGSFIAFVRRGGEWRIRLAAVDETDAELAAGGDEGLYSGSFSQWLKETVARDGTQFWEPRGDRDGSGNLMHKRLR